MNSGMVVTFLLFPVRDIERNAHRCVVIYDRDAIINARKSAGLATNLARREEDAAGKQQVTSIRMTAPSDSPSQSQNQSANPKARVAPSQSQDAPSHNSSEQAARPAHPGAVNGDAPREKTLLQDTGADVFFPTGKEKWSKTSHGLKIAVQSRIVDAKQRQVSVSVRNTLSIPIRIAPGHPELQIQTLGEKGQILQFEPITRQKVASSLPDEMIAPGQTARYLITYEAPVLGSKQRLGVAVAQINAADEPVVMELTSGTR